MADDHYRINGPLAVLICYTIANRPGAEEEAWHLETSLRACGITPTMHKDFSRDSLLNRIRVAARAAERPSALVVFIMAQGYMSSIRDANAKDMRIQEILKHMSDVSMTGKPKIMVVQSSRCQEGQDHHRGRYPKDIAAHEGERLEGPDTMVIWSTLYGHPSRRNLFLPQLAAKIESAHRNDDVYTILNRACRAMQGAPDAEYKVRTRFRISPSRQAPAVESTLTKRFCIKRFAPSPDEAFNILTVSYNSANDTESLIATEQSESEHMSEMLPEPGPSLKRSKILKSYRIITWNLGGERPANRHQRLEFAKTKIKGRIPDAVLLQEVQKHQLNDLIKKFPQYNCVSQITQSTKFYMVTLLKQDRFAVTEEHYIKDNRFLATKVTNHSNNSTWVIVNCHLKASVKKKSKSDKTFAEQRMETLKNISQKLGSSKIEVIIIGGDMNMPEGEKSDDCLKDVGFKDAWAESPRCVQQHYPYTVDQRGNATFQFDTALFDNEVEPYEAARFDRIYIKSPTLTVNDYKHFGMESEVLHDAPGLLFAKTPVSDHYGVAIQLLSDE